MASAASPPPEYHTAIRPHSGWNPIDAREIWKFRDLLFTLAGRDLQVRYKQTALGAVWIVVQPLLAAGILSFVFGMVARFEAPSGVPYFVFAFVGMLGWGVFNKTLGRTSGILTSNQQLVSKVYFPRLILPLSTVLPTLVDFLITLLLLTGILLTSWHLPGANLLFMPVLVVLLLTLALGVGFVTSAIAVSYRDVGHILPVATQFLMYASPVAYALSYVEGNERIPELYRTLYMLNPLASLLEAFRWSILGVGTLHWGYLAYAAAASILTFVAGAYLFKRMERSFADVI
jgi:lipopolysaccharide transport system permease protein